MPCRPAGGNLNESQYINHDHPLRTQEMINVSRYVLQFANLIFSIFTASGFIGLKPNKVANLVT